MDEIKKIYINAYILGKSIFLHIIKQYKSISSAYLKII